MAWRIDPNLLTSIPARSPDAMLGLAHSLIAAAPPNPVPVLVQRIARLVSCTDALRSAWVDANRPTPASRLRALELKFNRAWRALYVSLQRWVEIDHPEHGERARELIAMIFPTKLEFLKPGSAKQWAQSERRLSLISEDGLTPDLVELAGAAFIQNLVEAHRKFGDGLRITKKDDGESQPTRILDELRALRAEIAGYSRLVLGLTDQNDDDAVAIAEAALEPILRFRKDRSGANDDDAESDELGDELEAPAELPEEPSEVDE